MSFRPLLRTAGALWGSGELAGHYERDLGLEGGHRRLFAQCTDRTQIDVDVVELSNG